MLVLLQFFHVDDGEYAFARGGHCASEKCDLPKGTYVKLQPQTKNFLDISNPKAM